MTKKRIIILLLLFYAFFPLSMAHAQNTLLREALKKGMRQYLGICLKQAERLGFSGTLSDEALESASRLLSQTVLKGVEDFPNLTRSRALFYAEEMLEPRYLFHLTDAYYEGEGRPTLMALLEFLNKEQSKVPLALARSAVREQLSLVWMAYERGTTRFLKRMTEWFHQIRMGGSRLNPEEILNQLLAHPVDAVAWLKDIERRVAQGQKILVEELVACLSLVLPQNDLIFAEALPLIRFRKKILIDFWRSHREAMDIFMDRFQTLIYGRFGKKMPVARQAMDFPALVEEALRPDNLSRFFLQNGPTAYAQSQMVRQTQLRLIRYLNIQAMEEAGLLGELSYKDYLKQAIQKMNAEERLARAKNFFLKKEFEAQLEIVEAYEKAFKNTDLDVFGAVFSDLERVLKQEGLEEMMAAHYGDYWRAHLKYFAWTSLFVAASYYFKERPDILSDPKRIDEESGEMWIEDQELIQTLEAQLLIEQRREAPDLSYIKKLEDAVQELKGKDD